MVGLEEYTGNILFYRYLRSKRNPPFLNRNLVKFLLFNELEVEGRSLDQEPGLRATINRSSWRVPTTEELSRTVLDRKNQSAFVLQIQGIDALSNPDSSFSPSRKKGDLVNLKVGIHIELRAPGCDNTNQKWFYVSLKVFRSERGNRISLEMPEETTIPLEELLLPEEPKVGVKWSPPKPKPWSLRISINFRETTDAKMFYEYMVPILADSAPRCLEARWPNITNCADKDLTQPLVVSHSHQDEVLGLGLRIKMRWRRPKDESILVTHNRQLRETARPKLLNLPRESRRPRRRFRVTFVFSNTKLTVSGLVCPYCHRRAYHDDQDYLWAHMRSWHDFNESRIKKERVVGGVEHWTFTCDIAEYKPEQRASDRAHDPREISVLAPDRPYNFRKYVHEGDDSWQKTARLENRASALPNRAESAPVVTVHRKDPAEVQERSCKQRKTFKVPKAPSNFAFFRSITKRPLQEGEEISESDDDIEMSWMQLKRNAEIDRDPSLADTTKRFLKVFDPFMREEYLQGEVCVGDALLRFARGKAVWLRKEQISDQFIVKIDELLEDKIISRAIHQVCADLIGDKKQSTEVASDNRLPGQNGPAVTVTRRAPARHLERNETPVPSRTGKRNKRKTSATSNKTGLLASQTTGSDRDVEMSDAPAETTAQRTSNPPPYDLCLCGVSGLDDMAIRAYILCKNIDCIRAAFHIDCIKKHWKPCNTPDPKSRNWLCNECSKGLS